MYDFAAARRLQCYSRDARPMDAMSPPPHR
jgi:hypothetical protein